MEWEDPPRIEKRAAEGVKVMGDEADELRANPGKWGVVRTWPKDTDSASAGGTVNSIRKGKFSAFRPAGAFDAVARRHTDGTLKVHAVFLGELITGPVADKIEAAIDGPTVTKTRPKRNPPAQRPARPQDHP
jgi:hypothetical protein